MGNAVFEKNYGRSGRLAKEKDIGGKEGPVLEHPQGSFRAQTPGCQPNRQTDNARSKWSIGWIRER